MDISGFDDALVGAYHRLMSYQWVKGDVPIDNLEHLARISRTAAERWDELSYLFPDGRLEWLEEQRTEAERLFIARSRGGKTRAAQVAAERRANGEEDG
jgi:uncharacterized protein YdaU (DUF1376 family)